MHCYTEQSEKSSLEAGWKRAGVFKEGLGRRLDEPSVNHTLTEGEMKES